MVQKFLPEIVDGDKRVLVIGGKPVPLQSGAHSAGQRSAWQPGRRRQRAWRKPLSARDREIAEAIGPVLAARGLLLVGLDVIGDSLTEINVTSPTCFQEILIRPALTWPPCSSPHWSRRCWPERSTLLLPPPRGEGWGRRAGYTAPPPVAPPFVWIFFF